MKERGISLKSKKYSESSYRSIITVHISIHLSKMLLLLLMRLCKSTYTYRHVMICLHAIGYLIRSLQENATILLPKEISILNLNQCRKLILSSFSFSASSFAWHTHWHWQKSLQPIMWGCKNGVMSNEGGITEGKKRKSNQLKSQHMEDRKK